MNIFLFLFLVLHSLLIKSLDVTGILFVYLKLHFTTNLSGFDVNGICVFINDNQSFHFLDDLTLQLCLQTCKDDGGHPYVAAIMKLRWKVER